MRTLVAWIFEDKPLRKLEAEAIVRGAAQERGLKVQVRSSAKLSWPPEFEDGGQDPKQHPDLVVLDLFYGDAEMTGFDVYEGLRRQEQERPGVTPALVIVWTGYLADKDAEEKVKAVWEPGGETRRDGRLVVCEIKSKTHLLRAVRGCLGRIEEETWGTGEAAAGPPGTRRRTEA
jgi:CheY-like chemotaxis protein